MNLTFMGMVSITTVGAHPDVAWEFVWELISYDFLIAAFSFGSIREDVFNERENSYMEQHPDQATPEENVFARASHYDADCTSVYDSPVVAIVMEEAEAFFAGDKTAEETARIIQSRVSIYLGEKS